MERRRYLVAAGATAALALGGCLGLTPDEDENHDVGMSPASFNPVEITVSVGEELVWENTSSRTHTVTAYEKGIPNEAEFFASGGYESEEVARRAWNESLGGGIGAGDRFSHTFEAAGTYQYFCIPHEQGGMRGTIVVEE
ncbi:MAG: plastocyanin/azurin family copper-binding protein [Halolamina sp.]|uniref:cupredoxin domain-containing protein n=1 Tax=Halolamina sp. TaxID=1940283 RepID=UPI002FC337D4